MSEIDNNNINVLIVDDHQIVIDGNLALALAKKAGTIKIKGETKTVTA